MNARLLLSVLRGAGVNLTPQEAGLHVDAPPGALTETLRDSLVENKEALIELPNGSGLGKKRRTGGVSSSAGRSTRSGSSCAIL